MVRTRDIVALSLVGGGGYIVWKQMNRLSDWLDERQDYWEEEVEREANQAGEMSDSELEVIREEARGEAYGLYHDILTEENRENVAEPTEIEEEVADLGLEEETMRWKLYVLELNSVATVQETGESDMSDEIESIILWIGTATALGVGGGTMLGIYDRLSSDEPPRDASNLQSHVYPAMMEAADPTQVVEFETEPPEQMQEPSSSPGPTQSMEWGDVLASVTPSVADQLDKHFDVASDVVLSVNELAASALAQATNKTEEYYLEIGTVTLLAIAAYAGKAFGLFTAPEPATTATGAAMIAAMPVLFGISVNTDIVPDVGSLIQDDVNFQTA